MVSNFLEALDDIVIKKFNSQFSPVIKAAGREIYGADDCTQAVRQHHLAMQFEVLELMDLDTHIIHDTQPPHTFYNFLLLQRMWWACHKVDFHAALSRPDQPFEYNRVLVSLVLDEERVLGIVNELRDTFATIGRAPDHVRALARFEFLAVPVGLKTGNNLMNPVAMGGGDSVVPCFSQILGRPIERFHKGGSFVHDHRLFMSDAECRVALFQLDACLLKCLAGLFIVILAAAAGGVEHNANPHTTFVGVNDGIDQRRVRENKHFDVKRLPGGGNCIQKGFSGFVGKNNEITIWHGVSWF